MAKPLRLAVLAALSAGLLLSCSSSSTPRVAFSCTDAGLDRTLDIAQDVVDTIRPGLEASVAGKGHGCDSTPNGVYDFIYFDRDAVAGAFPCRKDDSAYEGWLLCTASSGRFALAPGTTAMATIEALP